MARSFSPLRSLYRIRLAGASLFPSSRTILSRSQSSNRPANRGELYEIDTAASESQSDALIEKLEDAVHRITVRRSAPDWLPLVPGASYWVPPSNGIAKLVEKLANPIPVQEEEEEEESVSISSARGWPSSDYFINGVQPQSMETEVASNTVVSHSEEEEG